MSNSYVKFLCDDLMKFRLLFEEPAIVRVCVRSGGPFAFLPLVCGSEVIQMNGVYLRQTNSSAKCENLNQRNMSPYPCQAKLNSIRSAIWDMCHGQSGCDYQLYYPDEEYCPGMERYRTIILLADIECVLRKYTSSILFVHMIV